MSRLAKLLYIAFACLSGASAAWAGKTQNVLLVIVDGVRWQEVFTGVDPTLLTDAGGSWTAGDELKRKYWNDDPGIRRRLLFPFLWDTVATQGQLFGNQQAGSVGHITNPMPSPTRATTRSRPGWPIHESIPMSTDQPEPHGIRVAQYQTGVRRQGRDFRHLGSVHRHLKRQAQRHSIRAGGSPIDASDKSPQGELLNELYRTTTRFDGSDPFDSFLHVVVREHLRTHKPRVMFVGYGDTDTWQHMGRYDNFLETAHSFDGYIAEVWRQIQSSADYKDRTTLIISTDHGRGSGPVEWKDHGTGQKGSENIWIAVIGPDTAPLGERHAVAQSPNRKSPRPWRSCSARTPAPSIAPPRRRLSRR